ncbi:MAG: hypothetical protein GX187_08265 [Clostridiaceae bacterium]|nr:hypothetical protein [Clostridiaceae bacterium]
MKSVLFNMGYFLKEAYKTIRLNLLSNIFSFIGTVLILFIFALVITGWNVSNRLVLMLKEEAEISAYYEENLDEIDKDNLIGLIEEIDGVLEVNLVSQAEAYNRMENVLGNEAGILELFEENPFEEYIEIRIHLDETERVIDRIENIEGIEYVRDNREILNRIEGIVKTLNMAGYIVTAAVGITTIIIISHMIRQGIYENRFQINTLQLLGASNSFIGFPFLIAGLLMILCGGIIASVLTVIAINIGFGQLSGTIPFIPLPPKNELVKHVVVIIMTASIILGSGGSIFGLSSIKEDAER